MTACTLSAVLLLNSSPRFRVSHHQKKINKNQTDFVTNCVPVWSDLSYTHCALSKGLALQSWDVRCSWLLSEEHCKLTTAGQGWPADCVLDSKSIFLNITQIGPKYQKWVCKAELCRSSRKTHHSTSEKLIRRARSCAETRDLEIQVQELMQKSWRSACLDVWKRKHVNPEKLHSAFLLMKSLESHPRDRWEMKMSITLPRWLRGRSIESHRCPRQRNVLCLPIED